MYAAQNAMISSANFRSEHLIPHPFNGLFAGQPGVGTRKVNHSEYQWSKRW